MESRKYRKKKLLLSNQSTIALQPIPLQKLTEKEKIFVTQYMQHFTAARAAREAGYRVGTGDGFGSQKGWEILRLPHIKDRIDILLKERYERLQIEGDDIVKKWYNIAFFDISTLYDENNQFKGIHNLAPEQRAVIKSINTKVVRTGNESYEERTVVTLYNQENALEKLALHLGMLNTKLDITNTNKTELTLKVQELRSLGTERLLELDRFITSQN